MKRYLTRFCRVHINSTVSFVHVLGLATTTLQVFGQFIFLFLQDSNARFQPDVFLYNFIEVLFELQCLRVETLLVLINLFGQDACKVIGSEVGLHKFDIFAVSASGLVILILELRLAALGPVSSVAGLSGLGSFH